ncbi:MAG: carboxypeptidase regulatory-like domain-containing protein [Gemmatimonadota bacterium]
MVGERGEERRTETVAIGRRQPCCRWWAWLAALLPALHLSLSLAAQDAPATRVSVRVSGVVFDSVGAAPLVGALVQLVPASSVTSARSRMTDVAGAFSFDSLESGRYLLGFYHPLLDSLGLTSPTSVIDVRTSGDLRVPLSTPSAHTIRVNHCGPESDRDSTGVLIGYVRSATDAMGRARATVKVSWSEIVIASDGIRREVPSISGETSQAGGIALCGLPMGAEVLVRAWSGSDSSGFAELVMPSNGLLRRDLYVGVARRETLRSVGNDSVAVETSLLRGDGTLRGEVRRPDGRALAGARIVFWETGIEATSGANGAYQMRDLPVGTYTVEARALGFLPQRRAVDILATGETVANLTLESFVTYLDTVKVRARRVFSSRAIQEFEQRRKAGFGHFFDEDDINKRNPFFVGDLLRVTPGVRVVPGQFGNRILMRGSGLQATCVPTVFLDGSRVFNNDGDLDALVNVQDLRAMEVYTHGSSVPAQFQNLDGCGSLVLWTGGRRPSR